MAMTLRTDDEMDRALDALSEAEGLSKQEVVRRAVLERYVRSAHSFRVDSSGQKMIERWGGASWTGSARYEPVEYLDLEDLLALVRRLGVGRVRDLGLVDSAAGRPRSSAFGEDAYPTLALKAAALLHSIARNHALVDGSKRLAWLATVVFGDLNGQAPDLADDEAFDLVMAVAEGRLEVDEITERLRLRPAG